MTNDSDIFPTEPGRRRLPLYEAKMIHQFQHGFSEPGYWISEADGRVLCFGRVRN
jgi:hypothetical protein